MDLETLGLLPGTKIGHFKIVRMIGTGGMGSVYEAEHVDLKKRVAIKTLKPEFAKNPEIKERFLREGIAASKIRHPHAVDVFDVGRHGNLAYLVMEYLEGESLADMIGREGRLSVGRTLQVMIPVMAAVNAAHNEEIVHRDLKPENIFLSTTRDGVVVPKVVDFGISKLNIQGRATRLTVTDNVFGTPEYMSPEQIANPREVDARADQFALGVILFECVTGILPFESESMYGLMKEIVEGTPRSLRSVSVLVPIEFVGVVDRALQRDPADRFPSVAHMARELLPLAPRRTRSAWMPVFEPRAGQHPSEMPTPLVPPAMIEAALAATPERPATPNVPATRSSRPSAVIQQPYSKRSFAASILVAAVAGVLAAQWRAPSHNTAPSSSPAARVLAPSSAVYAAPEMRGDASVGAIPDTRFEPAAPAHPAAEAVAPHPRHHGHPHETAAPVGATPSR
jgi:eukaryotic-like serine/threonine-protein kinase